VTVEDQERCIERWPELLQMGCSVRFVSVEPMLGPVSFATMPEDVRPDWVIAGPETGPKARPCADAWIEALAAESRCFFDKRDKWTRREFPTHNNGLTVGGTPYRAGTGSALDSSEGGRA
jgi:protein gp37